MKTKYVQIGGDNTEAETSCTVLLIYSNLTFFFCALVSVLKKTQKSTWVRTEVSNHHFNLKYLHLNANTSLSSWPLNAHFIEME